MLSVENPPDPSCSNKSSQLKNDERGPDGRALHETDLLTKQGLGDTDNQLPKFSIRDYAFGARSKDIYASWPFHKKYLQTCLKHGVKDPLPPFETPDSVRNRCSSKVIAQGSDHLGRNCLGEEGSSGNERPSCLDGETGSRSDPSAVVSFIEAQSHVREKEKLTVSEDPTGFEQGGKENIPLKVSDAQCRGSESSPTSSLPLSASEANTLPEASAELEVAGTSCTLQKPGVTIESKGKKCRLIVKLGSNSNPSNGDDHTLNTTTIPDSMASKVCPVCKTFSSTSNTALNAHIDQCLAVDSTSKLIVNPKLSKPRVKPRKKRSMVDICATAPRCTLEELDRRNGSNWAADLKMASAGVEVRTEGKKQRLSNIPLEENEEDSAVYVDSSGTKIRILSKFNDTPASTVGKDFKPRKYIRECKDIKDLSTVKRRRFAPRNSKYTKLKPQTVSLSQKPDRAETHGVSGGKHRMEENLKKEESLSQLLKVCDPIKPSEPGAVGRWVCSKRTGLSNKFCGQDGSHNPDHDSSSLELTDSLDGIHQPNLRNCSLERSHNCELPNSSSEDPNSSLKSRKVGSLIYGTPVISNGKKCLRPPAGSLSRLSKGNTSSEFDGCMLKLSRSLRNHAGSPRSVSAEVHAGPVKRSDGSPMVASEQPRTCHLLSAKGRKATLRKKMLLVREASPMTKVNEKGRHFTFKKSRMHKRMAKTADQIQPLSGLVKERAKAHEGHNFENRFGFMNQLEETHCLDPNNIFESETRESIDGVAPDKDSTAENGCCYCSKNAPDMFDGQQHGTEETQVGEKNTKFSPGNTVRGSTVSSDRHFSSESHELGTCSDIRSINLSSSGKHKRPMCRIDAQTGTVEPYFIDDIGMDFGDEMGSFSAGKTDSSKDGLKVRVESSLSEVDVIPIPGPPGSFLPSPRGSEVLQGSSSNNSSRVSSFQDRYVLADRDLSGSPVSATSSISHPHMEGTDLKHSEPETHARSPPAQDKIATFAYCSNKPVLKDSTIYPGMVSRDGVERTSFERENVMFGMVSPSMGPLEYSVDQTCCCSRKESASRGAALVHEKSKSPVQCWKSPVMLAAKGNQMIGKQSCGSDFSIYPNSRIDEMLSPTLELSTSPTAFKDSLAATLTFPSLNDSDSAPPSSHAHPQTASHPVLRLMGKNLMVVNKDEDTSMKLREIMPGTSSGGLNPNYLTLLGYSSVNATNEDCVSIYSTAMKGPVIINQGSCNTSSLCYDFGLPNEFRDLCGSEADHKLPLSQGLNSPNKPVGGSVAPPFQHHLLHQEDRLNSKQNLPYTYADRVQRSAVPATEAVTHPIQEVIVIDGSPENDADSRMRNATSEGLRGCQPSGVGILPSTASNSNLIQMSSFPCNQSQNAYMLRQPPVRPKSSFLVSCPVGDPNSVKWKGSYEVSNALSRGPVTAPRVRRVI